MWVPTIILCTVVLNLQKNLLVRTEKTKGINNFLLDNCSSLAVGVLKNQYVIFQDVPWKLKMCSNSVLLKTVNTPTQIDLEILGMAM